MKNLLLLIYMFLLTLSCKAQIATVSIYDDDDFGVDNVYYKDTNNDYNNFEGTWLYTNGNTSFKIILQKKEMFHVQTEFSNYYADFIIGEYIYVENGTELVNSLSNLSQTYQNPYDYNITGGSISKYGDALCNGCNAQNQIRIECNLSQPNCRSARMTYFNLRYFTENGIEKLYCQFYSAGGQLNYGSDGQLFDDCVTYKVPFGEYIFVKQ